MTDLYLLTDTEEAMTAALKQAGYLTYDGPARGVAISMIGDFYSVTGYSGTEATVEYHPGFHANVRTALPVPKVLEDIRIPTPKNPYQVWL